MAEPNPYMPTGLQQLATLLSSLGAGFSQAGAQGRPFWTGISPGALLFNQAQEQARRRAFEQAQLDASNQFRERQIGVQEGRLADERAERERQQRARESFTLPGAGGVQPGAAPTTAPTGDVVARTKQAIAMNETGGIADPYKARGPQTPQGRAYGKYQVMDFNIPVWTQEVLGRKMTPEEFLNDPEAQEKVADAKIGGYVAKYGPNGAARAWFAGEGGMNNASSSDVTGTSVQAYGDRFDKNFGGATNPAPTSAPGGVPQPGMVPRPTQLPPEMTRDIVQNVQTGVWSPAQGTAEYNRRINELWEQQQQFELQRRQQAAEQERFNRSQQTEGEYVRGPDGIERFVPKAMRRPGQPRYDKPPAPGTDAGDVYILNNGDPASPEYAGAYNRLRGKLIEGPNGLKYAPDMSAYRPPVSAVPSGGISAGAGADAGATAPAAPNAPPGMTPIGERNYNESQNNAHVYSTRLNEAIPQLEQMLTGPDGRLSTDKLPTSWERTMGEGSILGMGAPEFMVSDREKAFRALAQNIVTAILRKESGAAIPESEYQREIQKYIPQPGDSEAVVRQKLQALRTAARAIAETSGRPLSAYPNLTGSGGQTESVPRVISVRPAP